MRSLDQRLEQVEKTGTSHYGQTLKDTLLCNRAGVNWVTITADEIYDMYKGSEEETK